MSWVCQACRFPNEENGADMCRACGSDRPHGDGSENGTETSSLENDSGTTSEPYVVVIELPAKEKLGVKLMPPKDSVINHGLSIDNIDNPLLENKVQAGDLIVAIGGNNVHMMGFSNAIDLIRKLPRPLAISFEVDEARRQRVLQEKTTTSKENDLDTQLTTYAVVFDEGPMGLNLEEAVRYGIDGAIVRAIKGQAKSNGMITVGDIVYKVNDVEVLCMPYSEVITVLRNASPPKTLQFVPKDKLADVQHVDSRHSESFRIRKSQANVKQRLMKSPRIVKDDGNDADDSKLIAQLIIDKAATIKKGRMYKQGRVMRNWKSRYFVLSVSKIEYFKDPSSTTARGKLNFLSHYYAVRSLPGTTDVVCKSPSLTAEFLLELLSGDQRLVMACTSEADKKSWIDAIKLAIDASRTVNQTQNLRESLREARAQRAQNSLTVLGRDANGRQSPFNYTELAIPVVHVSVLAATNLTIKGSTVNAMCEVTVGAETFKTSTVKNQRSPVWEQDNSASFEVPSEDMIVEIRVFDERIFRGSLVLAVFTIPIESLPNMQKEVKKYPLVLDSSSAGAVLTLSLEYVNRVKAYQEDQERSHLNHSLSRPNVMDDALSQVKRQALMAADEAMKQAALVEEEARALLEETRKIAEAAMAAELVEQEESKAAVQAMIAEAERLKVEAEQQWEEARRAHEEAKELIEANRCAQEAIAKAESDRASSVVAAYRSMIMQSTVTQKLGHVEAVAELIKRSAPASVISKSSERTMLSQAASKGDVAAVEELIQDGADVDATDTDGRTPLSRAAQFGHAAVATLLLQHGADANATDTAGRSPLLYAAQWSGSAPVVATLLQNGADANAKDSDGTTALMHAAQWGYLDVVVELLEHGARVDATNQTRRTALSLAAEWGLVDVVKALLCQGANVNTNDSDGRAPLSFASGNGHTDVITVLIANGAVVNAKDRAARAALSFAAQSGHAEAITALIASSALADETDSEGQTAFSLAVQSGVLKAVEALVQSSLDGVQTQGVAALIAAAAVGDLETMAELIANDVHIDSATADGRTALAIAAEFGRSDVAQFLLDHGASVRAPARFSLPRQRFETPLTLAGRAGHMKIFRMLLEAGAPVNVQSNVDGETPLISIARWDYFAGVALLIARGGALRTEDADVGDQPLIPATLATMQRMCSAFAFEFEAIFGRVLKRLQGVCVQLVEKARRQARAHHSALVTLAGILFRLCRLLFDLKKRSNPLARYLACQSILSRIEAIHAELDYLNDVAQLSTQWFTYQRREDESVLRLRFEEVLSTDAALATAWSDPDTLFETAAHLQSELAARAQAPGQQTDDGAMLEDFVRAIGVQGSAATDWLVSRDEVEFYRWNIVRTEQHVYKDNGKWQTAQTVYFEGRWRKTSVMVETSDLELDDFVNAASQWHQLSHPNVVELFGACYIGAPKFFVYELVPGGRPLHEFISGMTSLSITWKCLYEAALGLQYLHNRGVAHGCLRGETIIISDDMRVKLCGIGGDRSRFTFGERSNLNWTAPELFRGFPKTPLASDIYAFGICIWEAVATSLPFKGIEDYDILRRVRDSRYPERPAAISDAAWDLIRKMCDFGPSERVPIDYVVNRLSKFVVKSERAAKDDDVSASVATCPSDLRELIIADIGDTIPSSLARIGERSKALADASWLAELVCPALEFIFARLLEREMAPTDMEVVRFCAVLGRLERYLRTTVSDKSAHKLARSRKVAESQGLVYAELDRLMNALGVVEAHPIRAWKLGANVRDADVLKLGSAVRGTSTVSLHLFGSSSTIHEQWTRAGLANRATPPSWYLALRDLEFSEANRIGEGSFGTVYKGTWMRTPVVIKFMGYEEDIETISTDLLLHEVRVWHRLNHPHVLKLYGACHVDKRYFVCELASNGNLVDFLNVPENEHLVWPMLYESALGLEYLHSMNVAHNDLKGDNIMVGMDSHAKLIDFGLSCLLDEAEIQVEVKRIGAINWRSPEYLAGERPTFASDVYSFAMCIIEVVSGDVPWGKNVRFAAQVRHFLKSGKVPPLPDTLTKKQRNLIHVMMRVNPLERVKMGFVVNMLHEIAQDARAP